MNLPLYAREETPELEPAGNRGLWYERFFDLYNDAWNNDDAWKIPKAGKSCWVKENVGFAEKEKELTARALYQEVLTAHAQRQIALLQALGGDCAVFQTDWHFATGLGLSHPVENGLAWHPTLGVPYLAGSGVKGLLKAWIEIWDESLDKEQRDKKLSAWFGEQETAGDFIFFDAVPIEPVQLTADVMTPHMNEWYEKGGKIEDYRKEHDRVPADWHDSGPPVPFLAVRNAKFLFGIAPRPGVAARRPALADELQTLMTALENALNWLGAGAKTAAGYGRMIRDVDSLDKLRADLDKIEQAQREARAKALAEKKRREEEEKWPPLERAIRQILNQATGKRRHLDLLKALQAGRWQGDEAVTVAKRIRTVMQEAKTWKPEPTRKKPEKDKDYQDTLKVLKYLEGESE